MRRFPLVLLALVVLLLGGRFIYGLATRPDDRTQIKQALADALKASKEGRPGSVIDKLVEGFTVNDQAASKRTIAQFVKDSKPDVSVADSEPIITGDSAQITSDVKVSISFLGNPQGFTFEDAQILFKKEQAMDWLVIPTTRWQVAAVRVDPSSLPDMPNAWSQ